MLLFGQFILRFDLSTSGSLRSSKNARREGARAAAAAVHGRGRGGERPRGLVLGGSTLAFNGGETVTLDTASS